MSARSLECLPQLPLELRECDPMVSMLPTVLIPSREIQLRSGRKLLLGHDDGPETEDPRLGSSVLDAPRSRNPCRSMTTWVQFRGRRRRGLRLRSCRNPGRTGPYLSLRQKTPCAPMRERRVAPGFEREQGEICEAEDSGDR
jgi:hypothetical protein